MGWLVANVLGVAAAGAVLALGLWIGAPEAEAAGSGSTVRLGAPDRHADDGGVIPLGEGMEIFGQPAQLSLFWTHDRPDEVARAYMDTWKAGGLDPQLRRIDRVTSVSAVESETGLMRSVTIMDRGEETLVVPALTDIRVPPDVTAGNAPVPVPENAKAFMGNAADDTNHISYTASYLVPLRPEQVVRFYDRELAGEGYEKKEGIARGAKNASGMEYLRGPEAISVVATLTEEKAEKPASFVMVTHLRMLEEVE